MSKYKVNQGDIIRIGRITTRIKNIHFNGSSNNSKNIQNEKNLIEVQEKNKINKNSVTESTNSNSISNSKKSIDSTMYMLRFYEIYPFKMFKTLD